MSIYSIKNNLLCALLFTPPVALAEPTALIEDVLVTGVYSPVPLSEMSGSVTVLDAELLKATNKRTIADALRAVPGLLIEKQGGAGGLTAVSIRGGEANFTLVLVDGVQINDPTNTRRGSFDFGNIEIGNIERIEVVRGPQSALYGSDALSGVINIITRGATSGRRQQLTGEWGEDGHRRYRLAATGTAQDFSYSMHVSRNESGEVVKGSTRDNDEYNLALNWSPGPAHQLNMQLRYLDGERTSFPEQSGGPEFAVITELDNSDYTDKTLSVRWKWRILPKWRSELKVSRLDRDENYSSPGIFPFYEVPPQAARTKFTREQLQWVNSISLGDNYHFDVGADYRQESGDSGGWLDFGYIALPTNFQLDRNTSGMFLGAHAQLLPGLMLQGSVRHDQPDGFDAETTVNIGTKY
jgi:vitamin B12 transporter